MTWLQSHQLRLQRKQIASQQTLGFSVVAAIMPNKATKIKRNTCHHILGILLIWLH